MNLKNNVSNSVTPILKMERKYVGYKNYNFDFGIKLINVFGVINRKKICP